MPSREVEDLLRQQLALSARTYRILIGDGQTTVEGATRALVRNAFGHAERLRNAAGLLGDEDREATALLIRAVRYTEDPGEYDHRHTDSVTPIGVRHDVGRGSSPE